MKAYVMYYDKDVGDALQDLCQGFLTQLLIARSMLSTQNDVHSTIISHNFVTQTTTCQNSFAARFLWDKCFIGAFLCVWAPLLCLKVTGKHTKHQHCGLTRHCLNSAQVIVRQYTCTNVTVHYTWNSWNKAHEQRVDTRAFCPLSQTGLGIHSSPNRKCVSEIRVLGRAGISFPVCFRNSAGEAIVGGTQKFK